tara:strand:+ start:1568 stop:1819 length:252 start_codon:yes stop_codon:yes gene_type:complete
MDAYHKKSKEPHIEVIDITQTEQGVPDMLFEVNDAFLDMIKTEKNIDTVSQELLSSYVQELVTNCAKKKNEYNYEKILENPDE